MIVLKVLLFLYYIEMVMMERTEEDVKAHFIEIGLQCNQEHPVSGEEFEMLKSHKIPENGNAKCLLACTFKKLEWMDDKGMFNDAAAYKTSEHNFPNNTEKLQNSRKLYDICLKVNEAVVSDGDKGCDRAVLLTTCLTENSKKVGFMI